LKKAEEEAARAEFLSSMAAPDYAFKKSGTCEDDNMETIMDIKECEAAGRWLTKDSNKGFAGDMPHGGYTTSNHGRTRGCTLHNSNVNNGIQFFPRATGHCGTYSFDCMCKK